LAITRQKILSIIDQLLVITKEGYPSFGDGFLNFSNEINTLLRGEKTDDLGLMLTQSFNHRLGRAAQRDNHCVGHKEGSSRTFAIDKDRVFILTSPSLTSVPLPAQPAAVAPQFGQ